jgi:hypothetical protein
VVELAEIVKEIVPLFLVLVFFSGLALAQVPNPGHALSELQSSPCDSGVGQFLQNVGGLGGYSCATPVGVVGVSFWSSVAGSDIRNSNGGNVGVGTAPAVGNKLDVAGKIHATQDVCTDLAGGVCLSTVSGGTGTNYWTLSGSNIYNSNSGNVGVGTSNPGYRLSVVKDDGLGTGVSEHFLAGLSRTDSGHALILGYRADGSTVTGSFIRTGGSDDTGSLTLGTYSSRQALTILNSGNVGIGETSPASRLQVYSSTSSYLSPVAIFDSAADTRIQIRGPNTGKAIGLQFSDSVTPFKGGVFLQESSNDIWLMTRGSGTVPRITIKNAGSVGIGVEIPLAKLHVSSTVAPELRIDPGTSTTVDPTIFLRDTSDAAGFKIVYDNSSGATYLDNLYNNAAGDIIFRTKVSGTPIEAMRIDATGNLTVQGDISMTGSGNGLFFPDGTKQTTAAAGGSNYWTLSGSNIYNNNSGNVGIGKSNPSQKLDVAGNIAGSGNFSVSGNATVGSLTTNNGGNITSTGDISAVNDITAQGDITATGKVTGTNGLCIGSSCRTSWPPSQPIVQGSFCGSVFVEWNNGSIVQAWYEETFYGVRLGESCQGRVPCASGGGCDLLSVHVETGDSFGCPTGWAVRAISYAPWDPSDPDHVTVGYTCTKQ